MQKQKQDEQWQCEQHSGGGSTEPKRPSSSSRSRNTRRRSCRRCRRSRGCAHTPHTVVSKGELAGRKLSCRLLASTERVGETNVSLSSLKRRRCRCVGRQAAAVTCSSPPAMHKKVSKGGATKKRPAAEQLTPSETLCRNQPGGRVHDNSSLSHFAATTQPCQA